MIDKTFYSSPNLYDAFQSNVWNEMRSKKELEACLQKIVDAWCRECGMPTNYCQIKVGYLHNVSIKGEFRPKTNTIWIEQEMVVNKLTAPYYQNRTPISTPLSNKETMEVLAHEFRHVMQHYYLSNPDKCTDKNYLMNMWLNTEHMQNEKMYAYFQPKTKPVTAATLYHLQFKERDAFEYADAVCREFNTVMQQRFPNDLSFYIHDTFSNYFELLDGASTALDAHNPILAVDDMIRHINGLPTVEQLNETIVQTVEQFYVKSRRQQKKEQTMQLFPFDMRVPYKNVSEHFIHTDGPIISRDERE